ncbi:fasciclin domain-containing protein [Aquimarina sp. ERC-38]|uniref:fasciclin domain-containing protein n=1 Tax=Aquimarina sp. ERC-38 TaxID=2949996 RepID=UPI0022480A38|nr:fasciclin domain-containing protein [Aquimarina sp. ERC-38]UZO79235.1 fasciclin domain-containing protein [Aquimarina sp. ERC-38]
MKNYFKKFLLPFISVIMLTVLFSCQEDDNNSIPEPEPIGIEESPIISFDEIDELTQNTVDGELNLPEDDQVVTKNGIKISRERFTYDFNAEVNSGSGVGTVLSGRLRLNITLYHASFALIRGRLTLPDGSRARTRGAIVSDGTVYLIIELGRFDRVAGIGRIGKDGNLAGRFALFANGLGRGDWTAELVNSTVPTQTIVDLIVADGRFTSLVGALQEAELVETLSGKGPFTVFAPTDEAFSALSAVPSGDDLLQVLLYHGLSGKFNTRKLLVEKMTETLQGSKVKVSLNDNNEIVINDTVKLLEANITGSNGIFHVIDAVLIPPTPKTIVEIAVETPELSTLVSAVQAAGLVDALNGEGPLTVFAPTNDAFAALSALPEGDALTEVLTYHVASGAFSAADLLEKQTVTTLQGDEVTIEQQGDKVLLNGSIEVAIADIEASNGIVHVITGVLIPAVAPSKTIVEIALETPELSTLVSAVQAAGLVDALNGEGPLTVFAPTNDAFAALSALPEGDALTEVLTYHVASGAFSAADLLEKQTVTTLQGDEVTIEQQGDKVLLNGSIEVAIADIEASNGIVHVITGVLIPEQDNTPTILDIVKKNDNFSILYGIIGSLGLEDALNGTNPITVFAPNNRAFQKNPGISMSEYETIIKNHILAGSFKASNLLDQGSVRNIQQKKITVKQDKKGNVVVANQAKVIRADIEASNGTVHIINDVLLLK